MFAFVLVMASVGLVAWIRLRASLRDLQDSLDRLSDSAATESQVRDLTQRVYRAERLIAELSTARPAADPVMAAHPATEPPPVTELPPPEITEELPEPVADFPNSTEPPIYAEGAPAPPSIGNRLRAMLSNEDLEALVGGSLFNKVGAVVLVIGIASFLPYSFGRMNVGGRAALALAVSIIILGTGIWTERRESYRWFARGLIGAGWAALYATAYAIYALPAARIIENPFVGSLGLLLVGAGMIAHSLRYRVQAITATAYFAAFAALAATPSTPFATVSLIPLAASLLYLADRFNWHSMAIFGLAATYATCISRGSSNAPIAATESLFVVYWLLFESFDLLRVRKRLSAGGTVWIGPLNAVAFLGLSYLAWSQKEADLLWLAAVGGSALYLASAMLRVWLLPPSSLPPNCDLQSRLRQGSYEFALTLAAVLAGFAIVGKVPGVWTSGCLAVEAEILYLAGVSFSSRFVRVCGGLAFASSLGWLVYGDASYTQSTVLGWTIWNWTPPALFHAFLFYTNRVLRPNKIFSSAAAMLVAAILAVEAPHEYIGASWLILGLALLGIGLRKRLAEFRVQAYALGGLGAVAAVYLAREHFPTPQTTVLKIEVALSLIVAEAYALCSHFYRDRLDADEGRAFAKGASAITAVLAATLIWQIVPNEYLALGFVLLALLVFEAGNRGLPEEMRIMSWPVMALGIFGGLLTHSFEKFGAAWSCYLGISLSAWAMAVRAAWIPPANLQGRERAAFTDVMGGVGIFAAMIFLWITLPDPAVSTAWMILGIVLIEVGGVGSVESFRIFGIGALAITLARAFGFDIEVAGRWNGLSERVLSTVPVVACAYFMADRFKRQNRNRLELITATALSLVATLLLAALLYQSVSGGLFTVALGLEGLALLAAGFPLRERVLRLQGLALLLVCILKLFVYDLRNLETMYRILSFIALGLIMLGVSWIYARFREQMQKLL